MTPDTGTRWKFEQERDERIFQRRWFEDFRAWCAQSRRASHAIFRAKLDAACDEHVIRYGRVPALS